MSSTVGSLTSADRVRCYCGAPADGGKVELNRIDGDPVMGVTLCEAHFAKMTDLLMDRAFRMVDWGRVMDARAGDL